MIFAMPNRKLLLNTVLFAGLIGGAASLSAEGVDVILQMGAESSISFTADQSSFNLSFSDFTPGETTDTATINYTVVANDVTRVTDVVQVRMDVLFDGMDLQADMGSYSDNAGTAHLVESQSGFVNMTTSDIGIADKVIDSGEGKILDGSFSISYRAHINDAQAAGQHAAVVTVSLVAQ